MIFNFKSTLATNLCMQGFPILSPKGPVENTLFILLIILGELLQSTASLLDRLLDGSDVLLKEWATAEMVEAVCEAMEQVR